MKILNTIGQQFNSEAKKILETVGTVSYAVLVQEELKSAVGDCEVLIIGLGLRVDKDIIGHASKLKLIATATTGLDHIDVAYAQKKGITILNLKDTDLQSITGTAELAFGLLLMLVRHIPQSLDNVKSGKWDRERFLGNNLFGKTLGVVGLGRLGSMMAQYGKAFGMNVIAYDPYKNTSNIAQLVDFETLLSKSDIISIHAPLNYQTIDMFNEPVFKQMKASAYLINTARGAIINERDLLTALENKTISGYSADVLSGEIEFKKDASDQILVKYAKNHDNIIITPHIGGYTAESRAMTDVIIAKKVQDFAK